MPFGNGSGRKWINQMLHYNEILDGFEGSDDIDDDDETNNGDVMTIDNLVGDDEVDPDTEEPVADDFCQDFIGR